MRTLKVKNIGPIKEAYLELKKINILIGPQSTGKSTLAKLVSYCTWVEKEICLNLSPEEFEADGYFEENLVVFHKLKGFISDESYIEFNSDVISFVYSNRKFSFNWKSFKEYKRIKTLYIPAERNIVAVIPNWFEVNLGRNNTRSYLADWERVRKFYSNDNKLQLLDLAKYNYDDNSKKDYIDIGDNKKIELGVASSGLQTITPLLALFNYYSNHYYFNDLWKKEDSVQGREKLMEAVKRFYSTFFMKSSDYIIDEQIWEGYLSYSKSGQHIPMSQLENEATLYMAKLFTSYSTSFFIEEPELNLYPTAQYQLMNHMVESVLRADHTLLITTHSPYLLTSINNMMMAAEASKKDKKATSEIVPKSRWIHREDVAAWKIEKDDFRIIPLLDDELNMLQVEAIDDVSTAINNEFDALFDIMYD